jgi:sugar phosphate isomerase/epimerase
MPTYRFVLSAFGDEIADDLATQLDLLVAQDIHHLELRGAWGRNVLALDAGDLARARGLLRERGCAVSAIGSPIGKSSLREPPAFEQQRLERAIAAADALDTRLIRVFSFYIDAAEAAGCRDEVHERVATLAARAATAGVTLLHENEKGIWGDTPERCRDLLQTVASPALRMAFDPANFVQVGVRPLAEAWPLLEQYVDHVHIKDARLADGHVTPAGDGDGDIPALLRTLAARGYHGFLTLEPHLAHAGASGGWSGPDGMRVAIGALRRLLDGLALEEI